MTTEAPVRNNTCALIITHDPSGSVFRLMNALENQVDQVIIVDNASDECVFSEMQEYSRYRNVNIIRNNSNEGIAAALNKGMDVAIKSGYAWAITFDQDTIPFSNILDLHNAAFNSYPERDRIGAVGTNFCTEGNKSYYRVAASAGYAVKDYLITSGSLIRLEAYSDAGGFRDDFFIDNVDLEFSLRLRKKGWVNLITREWGMMHKVGNPVSGNFLGIKVRSSGHDSQRRYYMARNHVLMTRNYFWLFPYFIVKLNYFFLNSVIRFMIAEKGRRSKLKSSFRGLRDGFITKTKRS